MSIKTPKMIYKLFEQYSIWDQRDGSITSFRFSAVADTPEQIYEFITLDTVFKITYTVDDGARPYK